MIRIIYIPVILLVLTGCGEGVEGNEWDQAAAEATCVEEGFDGYLQILNLRGSGGLEIGNKNIVICPDRKRYVMNYDLIKGGNNVSDF